VFITTNIRELILSRGKLIQISGTFHVGVYKLFKTLENNLFFLQYRFFPLANCPCTKEAIGAAMSGVSYEVS
jgi:hypothetical protein